MSEWQPIETAPTERSETGDNVLLWIVEYGDVGIIMGYWDGRGWSDSHGHGSNDLKPTHWMPLPEPPK